MPTAARLRPFTSNCEYSAARGHGDPGVAVIASLQGGPSSRPGSSPSRRRPLGTLHGQPYRVGVDVKCVRFAPYTSAATSAATATVMPTQRRTQRHRAVLPSVQREAHTTDDRHGKHRCARVGHCVATARRSRRQPAGAAPRWPPPNATRPTIRSHPTPSVEPVELEARAAARAPRSGPIGMNGDAAIAITTAIIAARPHPSPSREASRIA